MEAVIRGGRFVLVVKPGMFLCFERFVSLASGVVAGLEAANVVMLMEPATRAAAKTVAMVLNFFMMILLSKQIVFFF